MSDIYLSVQVGTFRAMINQQLKRAVLKARLPNESRKKMAARLEIAYSTLCRLETGEVHRNIHLRLAYCAKFGVEIKP